VTLVKNRTNNSFSSDRYNKNFNNVELWGNRAGVSELGAKGGGVISHVPPGPQIWVDQLTLSQAGGGADYVHYIDACPQEFSDLPTSLENRERCR
jgi:hypothetical protein